MSMIKIENLTFAYPGSYDNVFEDLSLTLDTDWRLGLVGRNGRGKTTLLRLLLGEHKYSGKITSSVRFEYFPRPVPDGSLPTLEVLRRACLEAEDWELERELSLLGLEAQTLERPFATLSNGERTRALLAALFLGDDRFPLIDEPTNHLDINGRERVAAYLRRKRGFILVSHDRRFLDGCVDHILSINRSDTQVQGGSFSSFMENFERRQKSEAIQNERLKADIARLRQSAKRAEDWSYKLEKTKTSAADSGHVGHKAAKMMKRSKSIQARQEKAAEEKSALLKNLEHAPDLKLNPLRHHADVLVSYCGVSPCYGGRAVCAPVSFEVRRGERVALYGGNGSGKSSLLRPLLDGAAEHTGQVRMASGLVISHVPQDASFLSGCMRDFASKRGIDESLFKTLLIKTGFARTQFEKDMSELSFGQKKKVLLAASLCQSAHLYVWDEPLNFIDLYSRMQIERLILEFEPTMLFVEHDRAFRDAAATRVVRV